MSANEYVAKLNGLPAKFTSMRGSAKPGREPINRSASTNAKLRSPLTSTGIERDTPSASVNTFTTPVVTFSNAETGLSHSCATSMPFCCANFVTSNGITTLPAARIARPNASSSIAVLGSKNAMSKPTSLLPFSFCKSATYCCRLHGQRPTSCRLLSSTATIAMFLSG